MSEFYLYLKLGAEHITDPQGYDHILFIVALAAIYTFREWKPLVLLVTAFTIGHSITLALATLQILTISTEWVEFLIPVTIVLTCVFNYFHKENTRNRRPKGFQVSRRYLAALFFGLIHGLGFSNFLRALLGSESSLVKPLLAFNLGLEFGQLFIVCVLMLCAALFVTVGQMPRREWQLLLSGAAGGISFLMILERLPI